MLAAAVGSVAFMVGLLDEVVRSRHVDITSLASACGQRGVKMGEGNFAFLEKVAFGCVWLHRDLG